MLFIETPIFTEDVTQHLSDDEYAKLQRHLAANPRAGLLIDGTGGLRKVRWQAGGKGKSGGVRVIYYDASRLGQIRMILIYRKGIKDDLSEREKAVLRKLNEGWR
jgi:hypothetical protein